MVRSLTQDSDPGLYGPDSEAWRLNRESMLLLGAGPRALLLQIAHPLVAAGVNEHSDFRADPWRRLQGTLWSFLRIVYGTTPAARAEIRRLNRLHTTIVGEGYHARDPELSMWVHATLVDSTIVAADAWLEPIDRERRARFYDETKPIGRAFGIPESLLPADLDAFEAYLDGMLGSGGAVRVGPLARELAQTIVHPPLPGGPRRAPDPGRRLRLDDVAGHRAAAAGGPRCLRVPVGRAPSARLGLARGRLARLEPAAAHLLPPDAAGPRRGPPHRGLTLLVPTARSPTRWLNRRSSGPAPPGIGPPTSSRPLVHPPGGSTGGRAARRHSDRAADVVPTARSPTRWLNRRSG